jgi:hypothetical protein
LTAVRALLGYDRPSDSPSHPVGSAAGFLTALNGLNCASPSSTASRKTRWSMDMVLMIDCFAELDDDRRVDLADRQTGEAFLGMRVPEVAVGLARLAGGSDQAELRPPPEELAEVPPAGAFLAELFGSPALVARCFAWRSSASLSESKQRRGLPPSGVVWRTENVSLGAPTHGRASIPG